MKNNPIVITTMRWLHAAHRWLIALPGQVWLVTAAAIAMNIASDLGNTFGAAPRFGGPLVAWATLLAFVAFFALALGATAHDGWGMTSPLRQRLASARARPYIAYPLLALALWSGLQSVVVVTHLPRTLASPSHYGSDEMYYAHYNAWLLLHGQNPYVGDHLAGALRYFGTEAVTPLRAGAYRDPLRPPTKAQSRAIVAAYLAAPHAPHPNLDPATTHSYPALSFLIALPSVWLGLPTLGYAQLAGLLALIGALIIVAPRRLRPIIALLCLVDVDGIRSVAGSDFAIWTTAGVGLVWLLANATPKDRWLAAIALGAVCAVQQTVWFFAPFYLVWVWHTYDLQRLLREAGIAVGAFLLINLPWIVTAPGSWFHSLLLPVTLPLFPTGAGIVGLGLGGALPLLPALFYALLEVAAYLALLMLYQRYWARFPCAGLLLPMVALLLAWRSPSRYFILLPFLAILALALRMRRQVEIAEA